MKSAAQGELIENIPWNPISAVVLLTSWLNLKSLDDWELHGINKNESTNSRDAADGQRDVEDAFSSEDEDAGKSERQAEDSAARQSEGRTAGHSMNYSQSDVLSQSEREDGSHGVSDGGHDDGQQHLDDGDAEGMDAEQEAELGGFDSGSDLSDIY
jgi:hypothetical protein